MKKLAVTLTVLLLDFSSAFTAAPTVSVLPSTQSSSRRNRNLLLLCLSTQDRASLNSSSETPANNRSTTISIGGADGVVYDVNRLKRNLVQETVREYKAELWDLLGTPRSCHGAIETKLASLVQANPVSTTTDSNLLDGKWCHALRSTQPASVLLDTNRFTIIRKQRGDAVAAEPQRKSGYAGQNPFKSSFRVFQLEDDVHHPHVMDQVRYLGGLVTKKRKYHVMGLTRTDLDLDLTEKQTCVLGKQLWKKEYPPYSRGPLKIKVLYLDPDFCVSSSDGPYDVYTKNDEFISARVKRNVRFGLSTLAELQGRVWSVVNARKQFWKLIRQHNNNNTDTQAKDAILMETQHNDQSKIRVLKLGDLETKNEAWEGETDPFVHLSAVERQEHIKKLSVKEIDRAKRSQERRQKRLKKKRPVFQRIRPFKKPEY